VRPYIALAENMGKAIAQVVSGPLTNLEISFIGHLAELDTRVLKTAVLKGLLTHVTQDSINFVNANFLAEQRGITVNEQRKPESFDYLSVIHVRAITDEGPVDIGATLVGKKNEPRIIEMFDFELDMTPSEHMLFLRYGDVPGVVGRIGTLLGAEKINIGSMQVGRTEAGGTALMGVTVDSPLTQELLDRITAEAGIDQAWSVEI
ncbi:MAG TPA: ACT domain-containing protein, partial [Coriobacteriia bacterium]|nr:ACT domain-containing protein [Coriobacteriia bacterium]